MKRIDVPTLHGAAWAAIELERLRRALRRGGVAAAVVHSPSAAPARGTRGVHAILRRRRATCLERSLILQQWYAAQGAPRDVVIGVTAPAEGFAAHAWLDGDPAEAGSAFREIHRLAP